MKNRKLITRGLCVMIASCMLATSALPVLAKEDPTVVETTSQEDIPETSENTTPAEDDAASPVEVPATPVVTVVVNPYFNMEMDHAESAMDSADAALNGGQDDYEDTEARDGAATVLDGSDGKLDPDTDVTDLTYEIEGETYTPVSDEEAKLVADYKDVESTISTMQEKISAGEATKENVDEALVKLSSAITTAETAANNAALKLDEANKNLETAKHELEDAKKVNDASVAIAEQNLANAKAAAKAAADSANRYYNLLVKLDSILNNTSEFLEDSSASAQEKIEKLDEILDAKAEEIENDLADISSKSEEVKSAASDFNKSFNNLKEKIKDLGDAVKDAYNKQQTLEAIDKRYEDAKDAYAKLEEDYNTAIKVLEDNDELVKHEDGTPYTKGELEKLKSELDDALEEANEAVQTAEASVAQYQDGGTKATQLKEIQDAKKVLADAQNSEDGDVSAAAATVAELVLKYELGVTDYAITTDPISQVTYYSCTKDNNTIRYGYALDVNGNINVYEMEAIDYKTAKVDGNDVTLSSDGSNYHYTDANGNDVTILTEVGDEANRYYTLEECPEDTITVGNGTNEWKQYAVVSLVTITKGKKTYNVTGMYDSAEGKINMDKSAISNGNWYPVTSGGFDNWGYYTVDFRYVYVNIDGSDYILYKMDNKYFIYIDGEKQFLTDDYVISSSTETAFDGYNNSPKYDGDNCKRNIISILAKTSVAVEDKTYYVLPDNADVAGSNAALNDFETNYEKNYQAAKDNLEAAQAGLETAQENDKAAQTALEKYVAMHETKDEYGYVLDEYNLGSLDNLPTNIVDLVTNIDGANLEVIGSTISSIAKGEQLSLDDYLKLINAFGSQVDINEFMIAYVYQDLDIDSAKEKVANLEKDIEELNARIEKANIFEQTVLKAEKLALEGALKVAEATLNEIEKLDKNNDKNWKFKHEYAVAWLDAVEAKANVVVKGAMVVNASNDTITSGLVLVAKAGNLAPDIMKLVVDCTEYSALAGAQGSLVVAKDVLDISNIIVKALDEKVKAKLASAKELSEKLDAAYKELEAIKVSNPDSQKLAQAQNRYDALKAQYNKLEAERVQLDNALKLATTYQEAALKQVEAFEYPSDEEKPDDTDVEDNDDVDDDNNNDIATGDGDDTTGDVTGDDAGDDTTGDVAEEGAGYDMGAVAAAINLNVAPILDAASPAVANLAAVVNRNAANTPDEVTIADEAAPLAAEATEVEKDNDLTTIDDEATPLAIEKTCAVANIILALIAVAMIALFFIDKQENYAMDTKLRNIHKIISVVVGVSAIVTLCITENFGGSFNAVDRWTFLMAVYVVVQSALLSVIKAPQKVEVKSLNYK